jgi:biotin synthase
MDATAGSERAAIRTDWTLNEVQVLFAEAFSNLLYRAHGLHRCWFDPTEVQISTLLSIKTGACPEDCAYCPQSIRYNTGLDDEPLMHIDTLGMLSIEQAERLKQAGLDYYNHNLDSSESYYRKIITTRRFQDRLDTLKAVRDAGLRVCCGGIIGMGETAHDRSELLHTLATMPEHPGSVPINQLVQIEGTPLHGTEPLDPLEFVRTIAVARILMPRSHVRLSAGRTEMSDEMQALCFFAGANSIFYGDKLLTTDNPDVTRDQALLARLGMRPEAAKMATDGKSRL